MHIAIVGATGLVGRMMLKVLQERNFPITKLTLLASNNSKGKSITFKNKKIVIQELNETSFENKEIDIALFSAGGAASLKFAPLAAIAGTLVIDNSSAWRMDKNTPLVVPEVNPKEAFKHKGIIANPNCSTIQLVVALKPLEDKFGLKRVVISTYQSISGAGKAGIDQLMSELKGITPTNPIFSRQAAFNTLFHSFKDNSGYTEEENKIMNETRKIMNLNKLKITATCVRIPTTSAHGESVNVELVNKTSEKSVRKTLAKGKGIIVKDNILQDLYPTVLDSEGSDETFIGRIRKDLSNKNTFNLWIVSDNLRKGAATNAVQIAELFVKK